MHDGPARLGKYGKLETPTILKQEDLFSIIKDEPMPYNVPRSLAEWSVNQTVENAKKNVKKGIAVVHGSKYLDLRVECAIELEKLDNTVLLIANSDELMRRPRDLVDTVVVIRETINPNTALYIPFVDLVFMPLLAYMGVDLFGDAVCDFYAYLNTLLTSTRKYNLKEYQIFDFNRDELKQHNREVLDFVIAEIRENIKNGTLRNLVEERCCALPEAMSALRIMDKEYVEFLERYTQLY